MKAGITRFIPENIAPPNAVGLAIFNGDKKVGDVDISRMAPENPGRRLYSFGLVSDMHLDGIGPNGAYLSQEMDFFQAEGCTFCCNAGDLTNIGFWYPPADAWGSIDPETIYLKQMDEYRRVLAAHPQLPMYGICGNHESYVKPITQNLAELREYTGRELFYTMEHGNDVFIFLGQPGATAYVEAGTWRGELDWLRERLAENRAKRCFVFCHSPLTDDSGNPSNVHSTTWGNLESTFVKIMQQHPNIVLFHGHSHLDFNTQFEYSYANFSTQRGIKSVHVPSSAGCRIVVNGESEKVNRPELRSGYIVEVYENGIILRGYYFEGFKIVPIAQYWVGAVQ